MKKLLLLLFTIMLNCFAYAQTGSTCSQAIPIAGGNQCFTNITMSASENWYASNVTSSNIEINLSLTSGSLGHVHAIEIYSGTCSSLTLVDSVVVTPFNDTTLKLSLNGLTIGNTYYMRLVKDSSGCGKCSHPAIFDICLNDAYTICAGLVGGPYNCCTIGDNTICHLMDVCEGTIVELVSFDGSSHASAGYSFVLGGVPTSNVITFTTAGTYTVGIVLSAYFFDLSAYAYGTITVYPAVSPSFTSAPNPVCVGQQVCFTNTTPAPFNDPNSEHWSFGDGATQDPPCIGINCDCHTYTSSGTFTVELIMTGGCPGTITNEIVVLPLNITATADVACIGTATNFTINLFCLDDLDIDSWVWNYGDGTNATGIGGPILSTHLYPSIGSYVATLTVYDNFGNPPYIITVNVTVGALPPVPVISIASGSGSVVCIPGTTITYTITNYSSFNTYPTPIVFPVGAATSVSAVTGTGTFTVTWSGTTGGQIAVTVIDAKECQNTGYFDVLPCCTPPVTFPITQNFVNSNTTDMFSMGFAVPVGMYYEVTNQIFYINGIFTVDQNLSLDNCDVFLGADAKIIVNPGKKLQILSSHLHACNIMWDGIYASNSNSFMQIKQSIIEDGKNAIVSENGAEHEIRNNLFNKNFKSIVVRNYAGAFTIQTGIYKNTFTCRDYSGLSLPALLVINLSGTYDSYPFSILNSPHAGERSDIGCEVSKITNTTSVYAISNNTVVSNANIFDYLNMGIYSYQSNLQVLGNKFIRIQNLGGFTAIAAVYAIGKPLLPLPIVNYNLTVGGYGTDDKNTFIQCLNGVSTTTNMNVNVYKNDFNFITAYGVDSNNSRVLNVINIKNNDIKNANIAIHCSNNTFCNTHIELNKIKITLPLFVNPTGISIAELSSTGTNADYTVFDNKIQNVKYGIRALNLSNAIIDNNKIELKPSSGARGIEVLGNSLTQITSNEIQAIPATGITSIGGVFASLSPNSDVRCNKLLNLGYSIQCAGPMNNSTVFNNRMTNCTRGIWLSNGGIINQQGDALNPSYNKWFGIFTDHTFTSGPAVTSGGLSPFYVRSSPMYYVPSSNNFAIGSSQITITNILVPTPIISPPCTYFLPPALMLRQQIAQNQITFVNPEIAWLSKQSVFTELINDSTLLIDPILNYFNDSINISAMGKLSNVKKALSRYDLESTSIDLTDIVNENFSVVAGIQIESESKTINTILLNNLQSGQTFLDAGQLSTLRTIANECPYTFGLAVYEARMLLQRYDSIGTEYLEPCNLENHSMIAASADNSTLKAFQLYPNPNKGIMTLNYQLKEGEKAELIIYDLTGRKLESYIMNTAQTSIVIDDSHLSNGVYIYRIDVNAKTMQTDKFFIIK